MLSWLLLASLMLLIADVVDVAVVVTATTDADLVDNAVVAVLLSFLFFLGSCRYGWLR